MRVPTFMVWRPTFPWPCLSGAPADGDAPVAWLPAPTSLDGFMCELVRDVHHVATGGEGVPLKIHIPNSDESTGTGVHWITVAVSIERVGVDCPSGAVVGCVDGAPTLGMDDEPCDEDAWEEEACFDDADEQMQMEMDLLYGGM